MCCAMTFQDMNGGAKICLDEICLSWQRRATAADDNMYDDDFHLYSEDAFQAPLQTNKYFLHLSFVGLTWMQLLYCAAVMAVYSLQRNHVRAVLIK